MKYIAVLMQRVKIMMEHFATSLAGILRLMASSPAFGFVLFLKRLRFFLTRSSGGVLVTPEGIVLDSAQVLISYWTFFVERECLSHQWIGELKKARHPLVLDVGANAGVFTAVILQENPEARIIAIDPLPKMVKKIEQWSATRRQSVHVIHGAAGEVDGEATLHFDSDSDTDARVGVKPGSRFQCTVAMHALDSLVKDQEVFLLKLDVQGHEREVLKGAHRTVKRSRFLLLEVCSMEELAILLDDLGDDWSHERVSRSDVLFWRRAKDLSS